MSWNFLFPQKIGIQYDFKCILECKIVYVKIKPSLILKNIIGKKKIELIGSDVNEIDLNLLLPEKFQNVHNKLMIDIIAYGEKSQYWSTFINGKMQRSVDIINPINKKTYNVKLNINFKVKNQNIFLFDVIITDIIKIDKIINKTGLFTHDLRAILKSAQNITKEIEKTAQADIEQITILKELIKESINMCMETRTSLLPENIRISKVIENIKMYLEFPQYIRRLTKIFPNIIFTLNISTSLIILEYQNKALWHLLLNTIKNVKATIINIFVDEDKNKSKLLIKITDNGIGMAQKYTNSFLNRNLPEQVIDSSDTNANRGEGFLLAYKQWILCEGSVEILQTELGIGTTILLSIYGSYETDRFSLNSHQVTLISSINQNIKTILLVDDVLFNLKLICLKLIKKTNKQYQYTNFPVLTNDCWQKHGIIIVSSDECQYVLAANGMYGKEISQMIKIDIIIADIQMPELNGIDMIKFIISNDLKSKILINSAAVNNDNDDIIELLKNPQITFLEKGNFDWINNI